MCSKMLKIGLHFYIFSVQILIFNITLRMVFYLNTVAKDNMAHKTIFKYMKCFVFYHPELLFPSPWFCFQENTKINFGKKQTRSIPASQTLKYKLHITFRNKTRQQNNHVYFFFISNFHNLCRVEFHSLYI